MLEVSVINENTTGLFAPQQGRKLRYSEAQKEAITYSMRQDEKVFIMGEDIVGAAGRSDLGFSDAWGPPSRSTQGLFTEFGELRVLDTPISEAAFIGAAIGSAAVGMRPIVELMFIDFVGVCMDQLLNNASKIKYMLGGQVDIPLTVITRMGAGVGWGAQHSESIYSLLVHLPGIKVLAPSDAYTAKGLLQSAINDNDPVIFCDHKKLLNVSSVVPEEPYELPIGKARVMRKGYDITLVGISYMTSVCMEAANILESQGIDVEVVDLLSLSPIDDSTILESVRKTGALIVVDEDNPRCGMASDIISMVAEKGFKDLKAAPRMVTAPHTPVPYSQALESLYVPDANRVVSVAKKVMEKKI
jgi:pyruvate/2-oxoglutarate/acetoin dehydrogenase E1 component